MTNSANFGSSYSSLKPSHKHSTRNASLYSAGVTNQHNSIRKKENHARGNNTASKPREDSENSTGATSHIEVLVWKKHQGGRGKYTDTPESGDRARRYTPFAIFFYKGGYWGVKP